MKLAAKISTRKAFSLVEVVIALAIFSLSILSIVGLMSEGIKSATNSNTIQSLANISRNLRANLQATPFTNWSSGTATNYYFTSGGYPTTQSGTGDVTPFYTAILTPAAPGYPSSGTSANAYNILTTISYPYPINAQSVTNSYFIAQ